jgi:hypothetical protein
VDAPSKIALAVFAGLALGTVAVEGLHAQGKAPACVVVDIRSVKDPNAFKGALSTEPRLPFLPPPAAAMSYGRKTSLASMDLRRSV